METSHDPPPETILFVEDEMLVRLDMAEFLRECGYRVAEAANAEEAVEVLKNKLTLDLVITDIQLPGPVDGEGLARWVRENRPSVNVIIASAHQPKSDYEDGVTNLIKPYTGRTLLKCVRAALGEPDGAAEAPPKERPP